LTPKQISELFGCCDQTIRRKLKKNNITNKRARNIIPKLTSSSDLAYIIGVLLGDGYISKPYSIRLKVRDKIFAQQFKKSLEKIGLRSTLITRGIFYRTSASSKFFVSWFTTKEDFSNIIFTNRATICSFLRGFFDSDGCFGIYTQKYYRKKDNKVVDSITYKATFFNTNLNTLVLAKKCTKTLGFNSKIYGPYWQNREADYFINGNKVIQNKPMFTLCMRGKKEKIKQFVNLINSIIPRKTFIGQAKKKGFF